MRQRAKWLQDDRIIRIAGALLLFSPIPNYLISISVNSTGHEHWTLKNILAGFLAASGLDWLTRVMNLVVGYLMFRGKSSAWVPVLAILGFAIAKNVITFNHYYKLNHFLTISTLVTNVALFLLVFESEYRINKEIQEKLKAARARRPVAVSENKTEAPSEDLAAIETHDEPVNTHEEVIEEQLIAEEPIDPLEHETEESPFIEETSDDSTTEEVVEVHQFEEEPVLEIPIEIPEEEPPLVVEMESDNVIEIPLPPPEEDQEFVEYEAEAQTIPFAPKQTAKVKRKKEYVITKGAPIDFEGYGKFAEVLFCSENELWIKPTNHVPLDIHKRAVTLEVPGQNGTILMKFAGLKDDSTLIFKVVV